MTKTDLFLLTSLLSITATVSAAPVLGVGTPANSYLSVPSGVSPRFGTLISFDELTPNTFLNPAQYASLGVASINSPDALIVLPYSTQSGPNEIFDSSVNGTADISVRLISGVGAVSVGIADSDPVTITMQALNSTGNTFGTAFTINVATTGDPNNPGNGYYLLTDSSPDIYGFVLMQTVGNGSYSGLAIDDLQIAPEPAGIALLALGGVVVATLKLRRKQV